jgi:hypothetical protein
MSVARRQLQDVGNLNVLVCQVVQAIGVVPVEPEVWRRGFHPSQAFDYRIGWIPAVCIPPVTA